MEESKINKTAEECFFFVCVCLWVLPLFPAVKTAGETAFSFCKDANRNTHIRTRLQNDTRREKKTAALLLDKRGFKRSEIEKRFLYHLAL